MKVFGLLLLSGLSPSSGARTYVDSLGIEHTTDKENPTIVTWTHRAVSLKYYGLTSDQLLGTYGEYANSGSDYNFTDVEKGSSFPLDPTPEEIEFLRQSGASLSPGCVDFAGYCTEFDVEVLKALNPDFLIVHGYRHSAWAIGPNIENITLALGDGALIYDEVALNGENCTEANHETCHGKSMIEMIETNFELAEFLGFDVPESLHEDRQNLCAAAEEFRSNMKTAQDKGVRVMASYLTTELSYYANPVDDMVLGMFEQLGMPIMHIGDHEYFWEYVDIDQYFMNCTEGQEKLTCNDITKYPVDFWLYDHRVTQKVTNDDFALGFPDKAIIEKQYEFWPIGGRIITPFHAKEILDIVGPPVAAANVLHPPTGCIPNVDVTGVPHRMEGLKGGEYACFGDGEYHNSKYYQECDAFAPVDPDSTVDDSGLSPSKPDPVTNVPTLSPLESNPAANDSAAYSQSCSLAFVVVISLVGIFVHTI